MDSLIAAAVSTENRIGEPEFAINRMETWLRRAAEQNVELALFPELNVSGYVPAPIAGQIAEAVSISQRPERRVSLKNGPGSSRPISFRFCSYFWAVY
jgi:predicted amidohydrolase